MQKPEDLKVLIVDDDPEFREILAFDFETTGYEVLQAGNAQSALNVLNQSKVNIIVSDVRMPDGDGVSLLTQIITKKIRENIILVFVTGFLDLSLREALSLGADGYLLKPLNRRGLLTTVQNLALPPLKRWTTSVPAAMTVHTLNVNGSIETEALNFSLGRGGAYLLSDQNPPEVDEVISFGISFSTGPITTLKGQGRVRWKRDKSFGVEFLFIDPAVLPQLAAILVDQKPLAFIPKGGSDHGK